MESHTVLIAESFAKCIDAHHPHHGRIQGIDSLIGRACRMSRYAAIFDQFTDKAITASAKTKITVRVRGNVGVHLKSHIDILKTTLSNDFLLPTQVAKLALLTKLVAIVDFDIFFSRHGKENNVTVKLLHNARIFKCHGHSHHVGNLNIMTTTVSGSRLRIGFRVIPANNGIKLTQKRHRTKALTAL